jgi:hypothetical protein
VSGRFDHVPPDYDECEWALLGSDGVTADELLELTSRAGRNSGPSLMATAYTEGLIDDQTLSDVIRDVWSDAEFPESQLSRDEWLEMLRRARGRWTPHSEAIVAYRGATTARVLGLAWSTDREMARWFGARWTEQPNAELAFVFTVEASPDVVLAMIDDADGRNEAEVLLDTDLLNEAAVLASGERVPPGRIEHPRRTPDDPLGLGALKDDLDHAPQPP